MVMLDGCGTGTTNTGREPIPDESIRDGDQNCAESLAASFKSPAVPLPSILKGEIPVPNYTARAREKLNALATPLTSPFTTHILRYGMEALAHRVLADCSLTLLREGISGPTFEEQLRAALGLEGERVCGPLCALEQFKIFVPDAAYDEANIGLAGGQRAIQYFGSDYTNKMILPYWQNSDIKPHFLQAQWQVSSLSDQARAGATQLFAQALWATCVVAYEHKLASEPTASSAADKRVAKKFIDYCTAIIEREPDAFTQKALKVGLGFVKAEPLVASYQEGDPGNSSYQLQLAQLGLRDPAKRVNAIATLERLQTSDDYKIATLARQALEQSAVASEAGTTPSRPSSKPYNAGVRGNARHRLQLALFGLRDATKREQALEILQRLQVSKDRHVARLAQGALERDAEAAAAQAEPVLDTTSPKKTPAKKPMSEVAADAEETVLPTGDEQQRLAAEAKARTVAFEASKRMIYHNSASEREAGREQLRQLVEVLDGEERVRAHGLLAKAGTIEMDFTMFGVCLAGTKQRDEEARAAGRQGLQELEHSEVEAIQSAARSGLRIASRIERDFSSFDQAVKDLEKVGEVGETALRTLRHLARAPYDAVKAAAQEALDLFEQEQFARETGLNLPPETLVVLEDDGEDAIIEALTAASADYRWTRITFSDRTSADGVLTFISASGIGHVINQRTQKTCPFVADEVTSVAIYPT
ncbi:hypothetical protein OAO01_05995 [Oligoflexia bacterium]|nr:hypothetical protein [Oligoflexia bacterium]